MGPYVPFQGDKIYVFADLVIFLVGLGYTFSMMGAISADAWPRQKLKTLAGQKLILE